MALPQVNITLTQGGLGRIPILSDGVAGLLITGEKSAVPTITSTSSALDKAYVTPKLLGSAKDLEDLGLRPTNTGTPSHAVIFKHVQDFYNQAGAAAPLWLILVPKGATFASLFAQNGTADKLVEQSSGTLRLLGVAHRESSSAVVKGLKYNLHNAVVQGQAFAKRQQAAARPLNIIVGGDEATLSALEDYSGGSNNRVSMLVSSDKEGEKRAALGLLLGRLASLPVQRSLARVKNGALPIVQAAFTDGKRAEEQVSLWSALDQKRYIFFRNYTGLSGYYPSNDLALVSNTDDNATIALGRTIDKAVRLCYKTYVEEIGEEVIIENGKLAAANVKYLEGKIENAINETMSNSGEISAVIAFVDPEQDVISTDKLEVELRIIPVGYSKQISVKIGFINPQNQ